MRHEQHKHITVRVAGRQCNPDLTIRRDRGDDVHLLTQGLIWSRVLQSMSSPALLAEVRYWQPAFINVDHALARLVDLQHRLCVQTSKSLAALRVALEGHPLDLPIGEAELLMHDAQHKRCRDFKSSLVLDETLDLVD